MDEITEELQTILELIIEQRAKSSYDVFRYDFSLMRKKLEQTQNFDKYGITPKRQRELLKQLDEDKCLQLDYVEEDNYEWKHDGKWVAEYIAPDLNPLLHVSGIYISLPFENVRSLRMEYGLALRRASLTLEYGHFIVKCDNKNYELPQLRESQLPAMILEYAWRHRGQTVTRDDLINAEIVKNRGKESLRKICKGSAAMIEEVLSPFIILTANSIKLMSSVDIDESELQTIAKYATKVKRDNRG